MSNIIKVEGNKDLEVKNISQSQKKAIDCIFSTDTGSAAKADVENDAETTQTTDMKQIGLSFALCGGCICILIILFVLMGVGSKVVGGVGGGNNGGGNKGGGFGSFANFGKNAGKFARGFKK